MFYIFLRFFFVHFGFIHFVVSLFSETKKTNNKMYRFFISKPKLQKRGKERCVELARPVDFSTLFLLSLFFKETEYFV